MASHPGFAFGAIGMNHGHIYGQTKVMLDAGCRLKSFYRAGGRSRRRLSRKAFPGSEARRRRAGNPRRPRDQARRRRRHPRRARADGGARHAPRQGRDARQAGRDDARAARRAAARAGRDRPHPLDPLFRALHAARHDRRRRPGEGRRDRPRAADDRPRPAPDRQLRAARLVLEPRAHRRHPLRHRLASGRAVPVLHRRREGRDRGEPRSPISTIRRSRSSRISAQILLASDDATGFIRVDWFTQDGLPTWGDGRLFILGTEGTIELRKYIDIAGRPGGDHLFLVDRKGVRHIDCAGDEDHLWRAASRRRAQPHRDGDAAEPLLPRDGACAEGAGEGDAASPASGRRSAPHERDASRSAWSARASASATSTAYRELGELYSRRGALRHRRRAAQEGRGGARHPEGRHATSTRCSRSTSTSSTSARLRRCISRRRGRRCSPAATSSSRSRSPARSPRPTRWPSWSGSRASASRRSSSTASRTASRSFSTFARARLRRQGLRRDRRDALAAAAGLLRQSLARALGDASSAAASPRTRSTTTTF